MRVAVRNSSCHHRCPHWDALSLIPATTYTTLTLSGLPQPRSFKYSGVRPLVCPSSAEPPCVFSKAFDCTFVKGERVWWKSLDPAGRTAAPPPVPGDGRATLFTTRLCAGMPRPAKSRNLPPDLHTGAVSAEQISWLLNGRQRALSFLGMAYLGQ